MTTRERTSRPLHQPASIHHILVAWQAGRLTLRQAMTSCGIDRLDELYQAARDSGVPLRKTLLAQEKRAADFATEAVRKRLETRRQRAST